MQFLKSKKISDSEKACTNEKCIEPSGVSTLPFADLKIAKQMLDEANGIYGPNYKAIGERRISEIERAALGSVVLSECCKTKSCRDLAYEKLSLDLVLPVEEKKPAAK